MHACRTCLRACSCGGDASNVVTLKAPRGCFCCIGRCEHGIEIGEFCQTCEKLMKMVKP